MNILHKELDVRKIAQIKKQSEGRKKKSAYEKANSKYKQDNTFSKRLNEMSIFINRDKTKKQRDDDFEMDNVKLEDLFFEMTNKKN